MRRCCGVALAFVRALFALACPLFIPFLEFAPVSVVSVLERHRECLGFGFGLGLK
jgi:hypothetical protein